MARAGRREELEEWNGFKVEVKQRRIGCESVGTAAHKGRMAEKKASLLILVLDFNTEFWENANKQHAELKLEGFVSQILIFVHSFLLLDHRNDVAVSV